MEEKERAILRIMCNRREEWREALEMQLIHGDYTPANILCGSQKPHPLTFIDFDAVHWAPRFWDLARACAYLFKCRPEETVRFVQSYQATYPLRDVKISTVARLAQDYVLCSTWEIDESLRTGMPVAASLSWRQSLVNCSLLENM